MRDVTVLELLQHGVHFGHQQGRRHPKMVPMIFGSRNGISIIDLERTRAALGQAAQFLQAVVGGGGTVLLVGSKRQARTIVQAAAQKVGMPYVIERWIGGLFTNFSQVKQLMEKLRRLKEDRAAGAWQKYTKKEQLDLQAELERLERLVGGLGTMDALPAAVLVVDVKADRTAIAEAKKMGVPIVAICDTNVSPAGIQHPIPANDDATKSIRLITEFLAEAMDSGKQQHEEHLRETAKQAAASAAMAPAASGPELTPDVTPQP